MRMMREFYYVVVLIAFTVLGVLFASRCTNVQASERRHRPTYPDHNAPIVAHEWWPVAPGTAWNFTDTMTGGWTRLETQPDGHTVVFTRSDESLYWGYGSPYDLRWQVTLDVWGVHANHPAGSWALDEIPDEVWTNRQTGDVASYVWHLWKQGESRPPFMLIHDGITVPNQIYGTNLYYFLTPAGDERYSPDIPWTVSYQWEGGLLRVMFDEGLYNGTWIHEDWYFKRYYGPVRIEQWEDFARTQIRVRIVKQQ